MSRNKSARKKARAAKQDKFHAGEGSVYRTSRGAAVAMAVVALVLGIVVYWQLTEFRSMLGAMLRVEAVRLSVRPDAGAGGRRSNWQDVYAAYRSRLAEEPAAKPHAALGYVLRLFVQVEDGWRQDQAAVNQARAALAVDADNLVARLAAAAVVDRLTPVDDGAEPDALSRFGVVRGIVDGATPARTSTLYNDELTRVARDVMDRYVLRNDVAASLAEFFPNSRGAAGQPESLIDSHYEAFRPLTEWLVDLSWQLRSAGYDAEADACDGWLVRWLLGVIDTEADAGTRLLCAELLAEAMDTDSDARDDLRRLRTDFHAAAAAAPIDRADQASASRPAIAPSEYLSAFRSLVGGLVLLLMAVGALLVTALATVGGVGASFSRGVRGTAQQETRKTVEVKRSIPMLAAATGASALVATVIVLVRLGSRDLPSQFWAFVVVAMAAATGMVLPVALSAIRMRLDGGAKRRALFVVAIALVPFAVLAMSPSSIAHACRSLDESVGTPVALAGLIVLLVVMAAVVSPARLRTMAHTASLVGFVLMLAALVVTQVHRSADRSYQQATLAGRLDEMSARLGTSWRDEYLSSVRATLDRDAQP